MSAWPTIAALHPAADSDLDTPDDLATAGVRLAAAYDWERLRVGAVEGTLWIEGVSPATADWMDAAFLARHLLGAHRRPAELLDDLRLFVDPTCHDAIRHVVEATLGSGS